jgi:hypothetical protein
VSRLVPNPTVPRDLERVDYILRIVAAAPPLPAELAERLAALLGGTNDRVVGGAGRSSATTATNSVRPDTIRVGQGDELDVAA